MAAPALEQSAGPRAGSLPPSLPAVLRAGRDYRRNNVYTARTVDRTPLDVEAVSGRGAPPSGLGCCWAGCCPAPSLRTGAAWVLIWCLSKLRRQQLTPPPPPHTLTHTLTPNPHLPRAPPSPALPCPATDAGQLACKAGGHQGRAQAKDDQRQGLLMSSRNAAAAAAAARSGPGWRGAGLAARRATATLLRAAIERRAGRELATCTIPAVKT